MKRVSCVHCRTRFCGGASCQYARRKAQGRDSLHRLFDVADVDRSGGRLLRTPRPRCGARMAAIRSLHFCADRGEVELIFGTPQETLLAMTSKNPPPLVTIGSWETNSRHWLVVSPKSNRSKDLVAKAWPRESGSTRHSILSKGARG